MIAPESAAQNFLLEGEFQESSQLKVGNIHRTWLVSCSSHLRRHRYVLQRLNRQVFTQPQQLMDGLERVCRHLQQHPQPGFQSLSLVPCHNGQGYYIDPEGEFWRCYPYIESSRFFNSSNDLVIIEQAALAFGGFLHQLQGFPQPLPPPPIPRFHDGRWRLEQLQQAIEADGSNRAASVKAEIDFFWERAELMQLPVKLLESGALPQGLCHNDTKLNNILFDADQPQAICVIDLDTVMPGTPLYDFGDLMRSCCSGVAEDSTDLAQAGIKLPIYRAGLRGYLAGCAGILSEREAELLPRSIAMMTLIIGSRFLTDYLNGDRYFRTDHPLHNLNRVHNQMTLIRSLEQQQTEMDTILHELLHQPKRGEQQETDTLA